MIGTDNDLKNKETQATCEFCDNDFKQSVAVREYTGGLHDVVRKVGINMSYTCKFCGGQFCTDHRLPENHDCVGLMIWKVRRQEQFFKVEQGQVQDLEYSKEPVYSTKQKSTQVKEAQVINIQESPASTTAETEPIKEPYTVNEKKWRKHDLKSNEGHKNSIVESLKSKQDLIKNLFKKKKS